MDPDLAMQSAISFRRAKQLRQISEEWLKAQISGLCVATLLELLANSLTVKVTAAAIAVLAMLCGVISMTYRIRSQTERRNGVELQAKARGE